MLAEYSRRTERMRRFDEAMTALQAKLKIGRKLTREEMNER